MHTFVHVFAHYNDNSSVFVFVLDYFHLPADAVRKCKLFGTRLECQLRFVSIIRQALELDGQIFHFTQAAGVFVPNPLLLQGWREVPPFVGRVLNLDLFGSREWRVVHLGVRLVVMMFLAVQLVEVLLFPAHMLFDGDLLAAGLVLVVFFAVELVVLRP